jgi:hypothetical protein
MKSVHRDWAFSLEKSRAPRVNRTQTSNPTAARVVPPGLLLMAEPVVIRVNKAVWVAMVARVALLHKAAREGSVAKALVAKRAERVRAVRAADRVSYPHGP